MDPTTRRRVAAIGTCLIAGLTLAVPAAGAATPSTDTTPPSVPQNLRPAGSDLPGSDTVVTWDASTDNSGSVAHYWVLVDGAQRARPAGTSYDIQTLLVLTRISRGTHTITVQAVDRALNRSAPSNAVLVTVG